MEKINIITRTSSRPNGFKRLRESIKSQTYENIHHLVISDNREDLGYIEEYGYDELIQVNRRKLINDDRLNGPRPELSPGCSKYSPHNLYFNNLPITDGWIMYIDDDDQLIDENAINRIMRERNIYPDQENILFFMQMLHGNTVIPEMISNENPPIRGRIGTPCILFHSNHLKDAVWDGWKCGDFRFINNLWNTIPLHFFIQEPITRITSIGLGNRVDI